MKSGSPLKIGLLVVVAAAQVVFIVSRVKSRSHESVPESVPTLGVGDEVESIAGVGPEGGLRALDLRNDREEWTLLLAFHPECVWCSEASPYWRDWLEFDRPFRVVAVTSDSIEAATEYVKEQGWNIEVMSFPGSGPGTLEGQLTGRTPWAYLFDAAGVIRHAGNGAELEPIDRVYGARSP